MNCFYKFSGSMSKLLKACPVFFVGTGNQDNNTIFSLSVFEHKWHPIRWRNRYKKMSTAMLKSDECVWHRIEHQHLEDISSLNTFLANSICYILFYT